jgi:hypothetical protein
VRVAHWLLQCALSLDLFDLNAAGFPIIAAKWQGDVDKIRADMLRRDQAHLPHTRPPPDWTGWRAQYHDHLSVTFVRDWRPQTKTAIEVAFQNDFEHARAVNALQRVPGNSAARGTFRRRATRASRETAIGRRSIMILLSRPSLRAGGSGWAAIAISVAGSSQPRILPMSARTMSVACFSLTSVSG